MPTLARISLEAFPIVSTSLSMPVQRGFAFFIALALALGALLPLAVPAATRAAVTELLFSEYIEGSSNNKALEIYNGTGSAVDLVTGEYNVQMFFNGSAAAGLTINLGDSTSPDVVANGDVYVVAQSAANATILAQADQTSGAGWFNGDDAVVLRKGTTVIDVIGQVGPPDPGTEWGTGLTSTADNTLVRKSSIECGDPVGSNAFDPSVEWDGFATDTFTGLGAHAFTGGTCNANVDGAPTVETTNPANGATGIAADTSIEVTFSEPVAVAGTWFTISCTTSGDVAATVSGGPTTWTLDPDAALMVVETCTVTIVAAQVTDTDTNDPPDTMAENYVFSFTTGNICTDPSHLISQVQGSGSTTPVNNQQVSVRGVVTADFTSGGASGLPNNQGLRGFFLEAATDDRDTDAATSEGVFVFDGAGSFEGGVGDEVAVRGTATDFNEVTQIGAAQILLCDLGLELPAPAALDLPKPVNERNAAYEPLESMRVTHAELTVTEFFELERFGEVRLSANGVLQTPTNVFEPGPDADALAEANAAAWIRQDDGRSGQNLNLLNNGDDYLPYVRAGATLRIGDQLLDHTAILHFGFNGEWRLQPVDIDEITDELAANRTRPRNEDPPDVGGTVKVASFNVLNYFNGDGQGGGFPTTRGAVTLSEFERQTEKLVDAITRLGADVYGLIEIENDGGEFQAARTLVDALNAEVGPDTYRFVDTGVIGTDEIKQAFIYDRRTVRPVGDWAILTSAVDPDFNDDLNRPALAQTFVRLGSGDRVTVVVNHLKSKNQSGMTDPNNPDFDKLDGQGFWNHTRTLAAQALADWVADNPTDENAVGTLIIGDLNSYGREDPIRALEDAGFEDQLVRYTDGIPYTFTFGGMQGTLDTALADDELQDRVTGAAVWHLNADEVPAIDYLESVGGTSINPRFRTAAIAEAYYDPSAFRSSDHDPVVIGIQLGRAKQ